MGILKTIPILPVRARINSRANVNINYIKIEKPFLSQKQYHWYAAANISKN